jgi:hypothetical protein
MVTVTFASYLGYAIKLYLSTVRETAACRVLAAR